MSGFEALGLACCVFQTISFTRETASVCKAIYQGQKTPDSMLEENAAAMIQAADEVKASCRVISTPEEKCLANIAGKCAETAKRLEEEVQKITKLHKEELDGTLDRYRGTMQNLLINQICNRSKALELQQRQDHDKLDQKLQSFIANIAAGRTNMEDLLRTEGNLTREHITAEATRAVKSVEAHVTKETQERELKAATENQRERLLGSLRFQEMNQRRNATTDPENATFERIFRAYENTTYVGETTKTRDNTHKIDAVWKRFVDWLRSGKGLFWIQGKPGSGKSTLVRIQKLIKSDKVKLCVASRPEPRLLNRLNKAPCLKLQDLTGPDMRAHIQTTFNERVPNTKLSVKEVDALADRLLKKAEGVFLWVHLAIQSVVRGIENGDSYSELVSRLEQLPNALEDLYAEMWKRLNQDEPLYWESAATYFQLIIGTYQGEYFIPDHNLEGGLEMSIPPLTSLYITCTTQSMLPEKNPISVDTNFEGQLRELCRKTESEIRKADSQSKQAFEVGNALPDDEGRFVLDPTGLNSFSDFLRYF
ncbi:hypothetical protein BHE90_013849 [Fusarium euwallaceae]|uniref:NACHT domain-containing protein n=1 Tax=Fusarium euwallaceae TaxID=1147111 RepID=A0A430L7W8_9HYPO|nr:hypothetical protein BHE90_013849 [Fusarium euwallaceae]